MSDTMDECPACQEKWGEAIDLENLEIDQETLLTFPFILPPYNICRRWHLCQHCKRGFDFDNGHLTMYGIPDRCPECRGKWNGIERLEDL